MSKVIKEFTKIGEPLAEIIFLTKGCYDELEQCLALMMVALGIKTSIMSGSSGNPWSYVAIIFEGKSYAGDPKGFVTFKQWMASGASSRVQGFIQGWYMCKDIYQPVEPPSDHFFSQAKREEKRRRNEERSQRGLN